MNAIRTTHVWVWVVLATILALLLFATPAESGRDMDDGQLRIPGTLVVGG